MGKDQKGWKSVGFEKLPVLNVGDKVGQETVVKYVSTREFTAKKSGDEYTVHKVVHEGIEKEIFGTGLINWFFREKVKSGDEVKIVYRGLENPAKKAGKTNRHQFDFMVRG